MAVMPEVWVPALLFGNLFSFFWFSIALLTMWPAIGVKISSLLHRRSKPRRRSNNLGSSAAEASKEIEQEARSRRMQSNNLIQISNKEPRAMVAPVEVAWYNIGCTYKKGDTNIKVLESVYGIAKPKEMMAIMGPSGAGKSTLLDILTMRKTVGDITGEIKLNGKKSTKNLLRISAYVPQDDNFVPTMTTLETMMFYAKFSLPATLSKKEQMSKILEVVRQFGLTNAKNTIVGGCLPGGLHLRGLSGGERRRLSIATGVVSAPSIIYLDEPTSGLDSFAALSVMEYMKTLTQSKSHTIIASIHQPRISIWNMFDKTVILSKGRMMYSGSVEGVVPWFSGALGYRYDILIHSVVSDWVIDLISIGFSKLKDFNESMMQNEDEVTEAAIKFLKKYLYETNIQESSETEIGKNKERNDLNSSEYQNEANGTWRDVEIAEDQNSNKLISASLSSKGYTCPWFLQFKNIYWRQMLNITRNPADVGGRMLVYTYVGLFIGLIFYDMPSGIDSSLLRLNVIFNEIAFFMFIPYVSISLYSSDREFYVYDIKSKLYYPSAYYVAHVLATFPFSVLSSSVFSLIVHGMTGMNNSAQSIFMNLIILNLICLISVQVLNFAVIVTRNQDMAFVLAIAFTAFNLLLSNFFIPFNLIKFKWVSYLQYLSAMGYAFEGSIQSEYLGTEISCAIGTNGPLLNIRELVKSAFPNNNNPVLLSYVIGRIENPSPDCVIQGDVILEFFDINKSFKVVIAILITYLVVLHFLTFAGLKRLARSLRK